MIKLQDLTIQNMEYLLGMSLSDLDIKTVPDEIEDISKKTCSRISFSRKKDSRKIGRGNPLLARRRFRTMDDVEKRLDKIK